MNKTCMVGTITHIIRDIHFYIVFLISITNNVVTVKAIGKGCTSNYRFS